MSVQPGELAQIYDRRFQGRLEYRNRVWRVLIDDFFQQFIPAQATVLDLGCGYGEFINNIGCGTKLAMDLNPVAAGGLSPQVKFLRQDCAARWPLEDGSLDVIFTSNFFEHLPDKPALGRTLDECRRCLKGGGRLLSLGPNIKYLPGLYWDFWDHHLPLTETALREALETRDYYVERCVGKFLPYTMAHGWQYPLICVRLYLRFKPAWRVFGRQFLLIARK